MELSEFLMMFVELVPVSLATGGAFRGAFNHVADDEPNHELLLRVEIQNDQYT
jgi:hypothetical protein